MRCNGIGVLVAVRTFKAQSILIQAKVGMDVDKTGREHAARRKPGKNGQRGEDVVADQDVT